MTYAKNAWYVAACELDLEPQVPVQVMMLDQPIVIYRAESGAIFALDDRCVHRLAPLSKGRCEGENIRCMYHGLLFSSEGQCLEIPGQDKVPAKAKVRKYPAILRHSWIWIWMGDPELADEALIPPAVGLDVPGWHSGHGFVDYKAEATLVNNNLLDLSHIPFIHADSFGVDASFAYERPDVQPIERGLRIDRWTENTTGSAVGRSDELVDHFVTYDYYLPGILVMWTGYFPQGTAKQLGTDRPDYGKAIAGVNQTCHAVTPTTKGNCRFHYLTGVWTEHSDRSGLDMMIKIQKMAFEEDRDIIEAQQKMMDITPTPQIMPTGHDFAVTLYNNAVEKLART